MARPKPSEITLHIRRLERLKRSEDKYRLKIAQLGTERAALAQLIQAELNAKQEAVPAIRTMEAREDD